MADEVQSTMETQPPQALWTVDGDESSWTSWAENLAGVPASSLMEELIAAGRASAPGWAIDIGCGTGRAFLPLTKGGYQVVGLDLTTRGLQLSRQRTLPPGSIAIAAQASAARLPLKTASAAFVFAVATLFHLSRVELLNALREIQRVMRPDGQAILHFLDVEDWRRSLGKEVCPEDVPVPSNRAVATCFCSRQAIEGWVKGAGLSLVSLELRTSLTEAGQQRNWLAWCRQQIG